MSTAKTLVKKQKQKNKLVEENVGQGNNYEIDGSEHLSPTMYLAGVWNADHVLDSWFLQWLHSCLLAHFVINDKL